MQPTLPQSTGAADMDLPSVQSVEWLFKKERMYLLAQFWQQGHLRIFTSAKATIARIDWIIWLINVARPRERNQ
ncbi:rho GTPase-activating protein gacGG-like [Sergentomyia squamirostris]